MLEIDLYRIDWVAISAIATAIMAAVIFWNIQEDRRREKERENREIVEKIIVPLISNLNELDYKIKNLYEYINHGRGWCWPSIKRSNSILASKLPRSIKKEIEQFDEDLEKFNDSSFQSFAKLTEMISLSVSHEYPEMAKCSKEHLARWCEFRWYVDPAIFTGSFYQLIFENKTIEEYMENSKKIIKNHREKFKDPYKVSEKIVGEKFVIGGEIKEKMGFEQIAITIKEEIQKDQQLQNYIEHWRAIHREALNLKEKLEIFEGKILK